MQLFCALLALRHYPPTESGAQCLKPQVTGKANELLYPPVLPLADAHMHASTLEGPPAPKHAHTGSTADKKKQPMQHPLRKGAFVQ